MDKSLKKFMDMSKNFLNAIALDEYAEYARELLKDRQHVEILSQGREVLEIRVKNPSMDLEYIVELTLHRSRMQLRTRNFRADTLISKEDTFIYRDQIDRRGLELFQAFSRLDSVAV